MFERDGILWQAEPDRIEPLYVLAQKLRMKPRLGMRQQIEEIAARRSEPVFARVLREATAYTQPDTTSLALEDAGAHRCPWVEPDHVVK